MTEETPDFACC